MALGEMTRQEDLHRRSPSRLWPTSVPSSTSSQQQHHHKEEQRRMWARPHMLRSCAVAGPSRLCLPTLVRAASTSSSKPEDGWELVVGLEIHAQLRTGRKLFSRELIHS